MLTTETEFLEFSLRIRLKHLDFGKQVFRPDFLLADNFLDNTSTEGVLESAKNSGGRVNRTLTSKAKVRIAGKI